MEKEKKDFIESKSCEFWIEDDIVITRIKVEEGDIDDARESVEVGNRVLGKLKGKKLVLIYGEKARKISAEARRYLKDASGPAEKLAIVVRNPVQRVIASFFMGINKPSPPTKIFTNIEDAKKWLKS